MEKNQNDSEAQLLAYIEKAGDNIDSLLKLMELVVKVFSKTERFFSDYSSLLRLVEKQNSALEKLQKKDRMYKIHFLILYFLAIIALTLIGLFILLLIIVR